jgi:hypothetical protein
MNFSEATVIEANRSTLVDLAAHDYAAYETNPRFISAIVADEKLIAPVLRSFEGLHVTRIPRRLFRTEGEARAWIASTIRK